MLAATLRQDDMIEQIRQANASEGEVISTKCSIWKGGRTDFDQVRTPGKAAGHSPPDELLSAYHPQAAEGL